MLYPQFLATRNMREKQANHMMPKRITECKIYDFGVDFEVGFIDGEAPLGVVPPGPFYRLPV